MDKYLKTSVRRSQMGNTRLLMVCICSLGEEWKDPSTRFLWPRSSRSGTASHSSRGRYMDDIWRPGILNDLVGSGLGARLHVPPRAAVRVTGKSRWIHLRQVACSRCCAGARISLGLISPGSSTLLTIIVRQVRYFGCTRTLRDGVGGVCQDGIYTTKSGIYTTSRLFCCV
jgi:hypothetical protein